MSYSEADSQCENKDSQRRTKGFRILLAVVVVMILSLSYGCYMSTGMMDQSVAFSEHRPSLLVRKKFTRYSKKSSLSSRGPVILLWTPRYSQTGVWMPQPSSLGCQISECVVTTNRELLRKSDAVVFHLRSVNLSDLPERHNPRQRWVLFHGEAPPHTPIHALEELTGQINWTATYRKDSDIHVPYGFIIKREAPVSIASPPAGRKLVGWLVSNCDTASERELFVADLRRFIPVDVYGKCGDLRCTRANKFDCYSYLSKTYKFYLSFENSICTEYVTEKLFNVLRTNMVPVVMGGANYKKLLPPNSYIDALSFKSPKQLAEYLLALDKNDKKYLSYLAWKRDYYVVPQAFQWTCELCQKLGDNRTETHNDLVRWWFRDSRCSSWKKFHRTFSNAVR